MSSFLHESLTKLGLNNLEAEIYIALSKEERITGYKISKILGKSRANVYNALESMKIKGLLLEDKTNKNSTYIPVLLDSYVERLANEMNRDLEKAKESLNKINKKNVKEGIFQLNNFDAVISRAKMMIKEADNFLLIDAFPTPLSYLKDDIIEIAKTKKELNIYIKTYGEEEFNCQNIFQIKAPDSNVQLSTWDGEWFLISSDIKESFIGCFKHEKGEFFEAIWVKNIYMTGIIYNGTYSELLSTFLVNQIKAKIPHDQILLNCKFLSPPIIYSMDAENNFFKELKNNEEK